MNLTELLTTLEAPIVVRPTRRMTQGELESYLDKAADILRGNADHSEFRGYVFALLFYKRINDCYEEEVRTQADTLIKAGVEQEQALKIKARNVALTEAQAAEVAAAILDEADKHCFPGWWNSTSVDPELSKALLLLLAQKFSALGLLAGDSMEFIGQLVQVLKRKHYKPGSKDA